MMILTIPREKLRPGRLIDPQDNTCGCALGHIALACGVPMTHLAKFVLLSSVASTPNDNGWKFHPVMRKLLNFDLLDYFDVATHTDEATHIMDMSDKASNIAWANEPEKILEFEATLISYARVVGVTMILTGDYVYA